MTSRQQTLLAHYARILARWPVDRLRPESLHFQRLLQHRIQNSSTHPIPSSAEANAAYLLLDNPWGKKFALSERMMRPQSQPGHYEELARELEEAPERGWWDRVKKRVGGMVRWK